MQINLLHVQEPDVISVRMNMTRLAGHIMQCKPSLAGSQGDPAAGSEPPPDPPGAFASALALGSGGVLAVNMHHKPNSGSFTTKVCCCTCLTCLPAAVGAVAVAAVGVFGVFQMALYVAEHSGRSASETFDDACPLSSTVPRRQLQATMQGYSG